MSKKLKKVLAIVLVAAAILSTTVIGFSASAAANTNYNGYNSPENSGDYAYWSGSKVVKSGSTTKDEIKWMQAALNYCVAREGLNTSYIDVDGSFGPASKTATLAFQRAAGLSADGSFGPATIQKMKSVLNDGKGNSLGAVKAKITTAEIQAVLNKYNYSDGKYWTIKETRKNNDCSAVSYGRNSDLYSTTKAASANGSYKSYNYEGQWECHGFAAYVMSKVTGTKIRPTYNVGEGWKKISGEKNVTELKTGDIVRVTGHTAIVLSVDGNGNCTFAEVWGSVGCQINIGKFNNSYSTLAAIEKNCNLEYVFRYEG